MTKAKRAYTYYSFNRVLSYNAVLNFICGARGVGKTFGAKKMAIRDAIKHGEMFIYMRRYKEELKIAKLTFFADIEDQFKDYDFRINGFTAEMAPVSTRDTKGREWQTIGYFIALSTAQSVKSTAFPLVTKIIFDEFIAEKGATQYLVDEVNRLLNFYSTVDRGQDKTIVFMLSNAVSIMNPYFLEYEIRPDEVKAEFIKAGKGFIVCHFPDSKDFQKEFWQTRFGQFIQGTEYAAYAISNEFRDNDKSLVEFKDPDARYRFTLETKQGTFSIWTNNKTLMTYAQQQRPKHERILTVDATRMDKNKTFVTFASNSLASLRASFRSGMLLFDDPSTRNALAEIFKR